MSEDAQRKALTALTEIFHEARGCSTPVVVARSVPGWQQTIAGEREITQALRRTLRKDKLHQEQDRFGRAYASIA
jgi:type I restriction enzyme R subunit